MSGILFVTILFLLSENEIKRNNGFIRKYIPHSLEKIGEYKLESNAFYIAGMDEKTIYLRNCNAPLYLKLISNNLKSEKEIKIEIEKMNLPFKRTRIAVEPPYFFLSDGTVPVIFRGSVNEWKGKTFSHDDAYFFQFIIMDSINLGISTHTIKNNTNVLGKIQKSKDSIKVKLSHDILKSQYDYNFDTDGMLLWDKIQKQFLYLYYYRNQYELADADLNFLRIGKTIDTISKAQLDVAYYEKKQQSKIGKSVLVNRHSYVYNQRLYINSDRICKDEQEVQMASIIDVYNTSNNTYKYSFYLYHQAEAKFSGFVVYKDLIGAVVGDMLWLYRIKKEYYN